MSIFQNLLEINFEERKSTYWLIGFLLAVVIALKYLTPPEYLFDYLYTGPILLANSRLNRTGVFAVTLAACILTLLNLFIPGVKVITLATITDRLIAVLALVVTE